ncbi:helix-turn-helix domain-containing protein [Actinoplanes sp. NPDC026623]|uniref:GlxA family transcriptional regulator n=1 Tax=Actinoplanes sp. NPDC026623 TaxID=3155610 RepID=UPI00340581B1
MTRNPATVGVIVGDDAPMLEVAVAPRVFGASHGGPVFDVRVAGEHDGPLRTTAGITISTPYALEALGDAATVIVPGWRPPGGPPTRPELLGLLRRAHEDGATVVGLCLGAFVLAEAGLLDGRRATTHWQYLPELRRRHPGIEVVDDALYVDETSVVTSAGSAAGLDACLHLLRRDHGPEVANTAARALVVAPHRSGGQTQFVDRPVPHLPAGDAVADAMRHALGHLGDPALDVGRLAAEAHVGRRTFDRRFREAAGCSPLQWLLHQRVLQAQELLSSTALSIDAVARASGFADGVAMRPHFRRIVGVPPQSYRASFRAG